VIDVSQGCEVVANFAQVLLPNDHGPAPFSRGLE
jgi:hypothetical protein